MIANEQRNEIYAYVIICSMIAVNEAIQNQICLVIIYVPVLSKNNWVFLSVSSLDYKSSLFTRREFKYRFLKITNEKNK